MIVNAISQLGLALLAAGAKPAPPVNPAQRQRSLHARVMLEPDDETEEPTPEEIAAVAEFVDTVDEFDRDPRNRRVPRLVGTPAAAEDAYDSV